MKTEYFHNIHDDNTVYTNTVYINVNMHVTSIHHSNNAYTHVSCSFIHIYMIVYVDTLLCAISHAISCDKCRHYLTLINNNN